MQLNDWQAKDGPRHQPSDDCVGKLHWDSISHPSVRHSLSINNCCVSVDRKENLNTVSGMKTGPATMTTRIEGPHKAKLTTTMWSNYPTPGYLPKQSSQPTCQRDTPTPMCTTPTLTITKKQSTQAWMKKLWHICMTGYVGIHRNE